MQYTKEILQPICSAPKIQHTIDASHHICSSPKIHTAKEASQHKCITPKIQLTKDKAHQRCSIPGPGPKGLQITPSPSFPPQLSLVIWGQSKSFSSVPLHLTSSIIKSSETLPKCDSLVYCPPLYPSSLGNFSNCYGKLLWEKCRWLFWAKRKWTCKQLGRLLYHIFQNHRHRQASRRPWCSLPTHFFLQQALFLNHVLEKQK